MSEVAVEKSKVVSQAEWITARKELLAKEAENNALRQELAKQQGATAA